MPNNPPHPDHQVLAIVRNVLPADLVRIRLERNTDIRMDILTPPFSEEALQQHLVGKVVVYAEYLPNSTSPKRLIQRALRHAQVPVIAVGDALQQGILDDLAEMGVAGYADRGIPADIVVPTIRSVVEGHYRFLTSRGRSCRRYHGLEEADCHIIRLIASGLTDKEIAERLGTDFKSVRNDLRRIFTKLGVKTRTQAVLKVGDCACMRGVLGAA